MKIFITGANGQLAKAFSEVYNKDNLFLATREKLDVTNRKQVFRQIEKFRPDIVFHFASMTRGDECAKNPQKAHEINVNGTRNVVEVCRKVNAAILFVSTNEVFDGKKKSSYSEMDIPNPITVAGVTKYEAEKIIAENLTKYFIVRTSWLFSKWNNNFLNTVLQIAKSNKKINLVVDEVSSPTYSLDLSLAIKKLISTKKYGTYHITNTGKASRREFAEKAFVISNIKTKIVPIKSAQYERTSKPPLYTPLNNSKAKRLGIVLPKWEDALERFLMTSKTKTVKKNKLVSIVIPTRNSAIIVENCLKSIKTQAYRNVEIIIADGKSTDNVREIAKKYSCKFYHYSPKLKEVFFDAPHKINFGVSKAKGHFIYWLDADMELTKNLIIDAVNACENEGAGAVIIPEDSFGEGIWAKAKQLERRCYWGDDTVESPRFFIKQVWDEVGGFDLNLGAGANDWDLHLKVKEHGYKVLRTKSIVKHNEGNLTLAKLFRKRFMYGREVVKYIEKRPKASFSSFFPVRRSYIKNWRMFAKHPFITTAFVIMRTTEYSAGFWGIIASYFEKK
jgi:dTDP-4-dehydrorhamnose reductase